jgi:HD-like signal output (HDOD) protein
MFRKDIDKIDNLPTLPTVFAEVDRLCKNPDVGADELSNVIETDPSITLKLLSLANSAFFGFSRKINTVHEAISLLGNKTVQNAILNISVYEATKDLGDSAGLDKKAFWAHSAGVGSVARFICKEMKIDRDEAFTAGIVHDMGKIVLDALYADFYREVLAKVAQEGVGIYQAEDEIIGLAHTRIGEELAETWNLGPELVAAIAHHHLPKRAEGDAQIAHLIHVGDCVTRKLGVGSGGDSVVPEVSEESFKALGVSSDQLVEWEPQIQEAIDKDQSILSVLQG